MTIHLNRQVRIVAWIRILLLRINAWIDARYCDVCHERNVRYADGSADCRHLVASEQKRKGGIVGRA